MSVLSWGFRFAWLWALVSFIAGMVGVMSWANAGASIGLMGVNMVGIVGSEYLRE